MDVVNRGQVISNLAHALREAHMSNIKPVDGLTSAQRQTVRNQSFERTINDTISLLYECTHTDEETVVHLIENLEALMPIVRKLQDNAREQLRQEGK